MVDDNNNIFFSGVDTSGERQESISEVISLGACLGYIKTTQEMNNFAKENSILFEDTTMLVTGICDSLNSILSTHDLRLSDLKLEITDTTIDVVPKEDGKTFEELSEANNYADNKKLEVETFIAEKESNINCLLYTSPSPRDRTRSRMPSSA